MTEIENLTAVEVRLLEIAAEQANLTPDTVLSLITTADWESAGPMYDWRNHIDRCLKPIWETFSIESRLALFLMASADALNEDWDSHGP